MAFDPYNTRLGPFYWLASIAAAVVVATLAVDTRYAKATDVAEAKIELKREMAMQRGYTTAGFLKLRKAQVEDRVFELRAKHADRKITDLELKQLFRYESELQDVDRELENLRKDPTTPRAQ